MNNIDDKGKLIRALHGKIKGPIEFDARESKTTHIGFTYYLNPDGTRSMEFDPAKNLFKNLSSPVAVRDP